jgi:hypothetical protein
MIPSPYEIIIICSVGGILFGFIVIWSCERYCCNRPFFSKRGVVGEPLLNLLEAGEAGEAGVGVGVSDSSCSFSSGSSSGSETTSIYMTKPLKNLI